MPILGNERHEKFAQGLARGKSASKSYADAGYSACRQSASRLSAKADIKQRVAEIREQPTRPIEINGRDPESGVFLQGYSGNPAGRPRGSRNKLGEQFICDLHVEWQKSGASALQRLAQDDPAAFVRVTASILPREIDATLTVDSELFAEVRDFTKAYRLAKSYIGADSDHPIIELRAVDDEEPVYGRRYREE